MLKDIFLRDVVSNICIKNELFRQIGCGNYKKIKMEYDGKIELEFKKIKVNKENIEIYISDKFIDEPSKENSCVTVLINKKLKVAYIQGISGSTLYNCFADPEFILKKPGNFYVNMTIKMLKKYKDKLNINKITLQDNAMIYIKNGNNYNLSQFKLLTEGYTWYDKYGFEINKENKKQHKINKEIVNKLKVKDLNLNNIITNVKHKKLSSEYLNSILKFIKNSKEEKLMVILNEIFVNQRSEYSNLLYSLIIDKLLENIKLLFPKLNLKDKIINKIYYERFKPTMFYYRL